MATPRIDIEEASDALVYAHFHTDGEAAEKYGVSRRSIVRWRNGMEDNPELAQAVTGKLEVLRAEPEWDYLTDAIRTACEAAIDCVKTLSREKADQAETLQAISEHINRLAQYEQMRRVIDHEIEEARRASRSFEANTKDAAAGPQGFATYNGVGKA